jgi:hypothetical protein
MTFSSRVRRDDGMVMPLLTRRDTIRDMTLADDTEIFVLDEFRLRSADTDGAAAALVLAAGAGGSRDPVPLLTSIDDARDVASLRAVRLGAAEGNGLRNDVALGGLVDSWGPVKRYVSRIAARTEGAPATSFRLAVTESGINDELVAPPARWAGQPGPADPVALLLIGVPVGTHAGLLVLVGRDATQTVAVDQPSGGPPRPLASELGVRVYEA